MDKLAYVDALLEAVQNLNEVSDPEKELDLLKKQLEFAEESDGVTEDVKNEQIKSIKKRIQDISDAKKYEKYDMNDDKHKTYRYNGEYYVDDRKTRTDIIMDVNNSTGSLTQAFAVLRKELKKKELNKLSYLVMQDVNYELFADSVANECRLGLPGVSDELVDVTLTELGLYAYRNRHPATLSGGQKQKVAVAVSKTCHKKLLMFDEPTSGLDYQSMLQVTELIRHVAEDAIVFIVSHDSEFLNLVCTQIYKLNTENDNEEEQ